MSTSQQMPPENEGFKKVKALLIRCVDKGFDILGKAVLWVILLLAIGFGALIVVYAIDGPAGFLNLGTLLPQDLLVLVANRYSAAAVVAALLALYATLGDKIDRPPQQDYVTVEQYEADRRKDNQPGAADKTAMATALKILDAENTRLRKASDAKVQQQTMAAHLAEISKDFPVPNPDNPPRDDVVEAQKLLQELGYDLGTGGCDGIYGPKTYRALQAAIRDGFVG